MGWSSKYLVYSIFSVIDFVSQILRVGHPWISTWTSVLWVVHAKIFRKEIQTQEAKKKKQNKTSALPRVCNKNLLEIKAFSAMDQGLGGDT